MAWRDDLRRLKMPDKRVLIGASFRGVPFFVEAADRAGGRRTIAHEFPDRDDPYVEDLGRRARTFVVEAYVVGGPSSDAPSYVLGRDKLLGALEEGGPGELVHPYHGVRRAVCGQYTVRESSGEGGVARFSIEFVETPAQSVVAFAADDMDDQVAAAAGVAQAASLAELEAGYSAEGMPAFALASAAAALSAAAAAVAAGLAPLVRSTQELARLEVEVRSLTGQAAALVRAPGDAVAAFRGMLGALAETTAASPGKVVRALVDAYSFDAGALAPLTTTTRRQERANQIALAAAIRRLLVVEAARLATLVTFESLEDATAVRDDLAGLLDEQAAIAGDEAYPSLVQLRADLVRAVPGDAELARVVTVERRTAVPSLVLAYQLYGSVALEADIVARNRARHPGLLAGRLQVLSRG